MINIKNKEKCCGCQACMHACPKSCISMSRDGEGFLYPSIDYNLCVNCGACEKVCPFLKNGPTRSNKPNAYAVKAIDESIRERSSSGGVFSLLSLNILNDNGIVYGVEMSENLNTARYVRIDDKSDLQKVQGSKYLQADGGNIFFQVKADLESGKKVLFSGVGCQIDGLKFFLRKDYENLLTVDVMCHGVPSPLLWKKYVNYLENKYDAKIQSINFRKKRASIKKKGTTKQKDFICQYLDVYSDPFMILFLNNYCLRESCYECNAKRLETMSDITLSDFWGIEHICPRMDDNMGTSLLLIHSKKGEKALEAISDKIIIKKTDFDSSIKYNSSYYKSANRPIERDVFFGELKKLPFKIIIKKYCRIKLKYRIKNALNHSFVGKIAKKILKRKARESKFSYGVFFSFKRNNKC